MPKHKNVDYETTKTTGYATEYLDSNGKRVYMEYDYNAIKNAKIAEIDALSTLEDIKTYLKKMLGLL